MTSFKVEWDFYTQNFDTTYPIFLQTSGVSPQEYSHAIGFVGAKLQALFKRRTSAQRLNIAAVIISMIFGMACVGGSLALTLTTRIHAFWTFFAISILFLIFCPIIFAVAVNKKIRNDTQKTYAEIQSDMVRVNQNFNPRGVQFIFKVSHQVVGQGKHMHMLDIPAVEVLTISNPNGQMNQPIIDNSYQPSYYQPINSQMSVPTYQTAPQLQQQVYQGTVYQQPSNGYGQLY